MPQINVDAVRRGYEAFRRRDMEAILDVFDPDVEIYQSFEIPWGGRYKGHDQARQFFEREIHAIESRVEIERVIDSGDHVAAAGRSHGVIRATGREFDVAVVHLWTLRSGRVVRFEVYLDNPAMLDALGR